jgi:hypothetical protein
VDRFGEGEGEMRRCKRSVLPSVLLFLLSLPVWGLDLEDGAIKVTLNEGIGRFSLYAFSSDKAGKRTFVPLLLAQDPRTTVLSVVSGNRVYRMGESSEFSESVQQTQTGTRFIWKSARLIVMESFSFVPAVGSTTTQGVRIDVTLRNVSAQDLIVGARYLLDTYLGEPSLVHFRTDKLTSVVRELSLSGGDISSYWVSPLPGDAGEIGLQCMTSAPGVTVPDRIVFANWKRLNDASWSYETSSARDFSLLPYSMNDSAVCQYYDPQPLARGAERTITLVLGKYSQTGISAEPVSGETRAAALNPQDTAEQKRVAEAIAAYRVEISSTNKLITDIDAKLSSGGTLTDQDITALETALSELKKRAAKYGSGSGK